MNYCQPLRPSCEEDLWEEFAELWGHVGAWMLSDQDEEAARLVKVYRKACARVQAAWEELVKTPTDYDGLKARASGEYTEARQQAQAARDALLTFAGNGNGEVGR